MAGNGLEKVQVAYMLKEYKRLKVLIQLSIFFATFAPNNLNNLDYGKEIH